MTVLVTSSGAWTLEGTADFVHPSSTSGEDGAEVVFEVDPNETEQERSADYVFKMGSKQSIPDRREGRGARDHRDHLEGGDAFGLYG